MSDNCDCLIVSLLRRQITDRLTAGPPGRAHAGGVAVKQSPPAPRCAVELLPIYTVNATPGRRTRFGHVLFPAITFQALEIVVQFLPTPFHVANAVWV
jgi:hypothetical protein